MSGGAADAELRQVKIKTGVVKRLAKETQSYEKEAMQQEEKINKMKASDADSYDVNKQIEVLNESKAMIPDSQRRLRTAYRELQSQVEKVEELKDNAVVQAAIEVLSSVQPVA